MRRARLGPLCIAAFAATVLSAPAAGQDAKKEPPPPAAAAPAVAMPDAEKIVLLVRSTLLTLNDALQTGNFTVLRDVGAPGFREANSASGLSRAFTGLAQRRIDLMSVAVGTPQLAGPPELDQAKGMLRIKGYFPGKPEQIDFVLDYQSVGGRWRLFGLSVNLSAPKDPAAAEKKPSAGSETSPKPPDKQPPAAKPAAGKP